MKIEVNLAFIDGQNLDMGTSEFDKKKIRIKGSSWVDLVKFRVYLREKYKVEKAYYFIGVKYDSNEDLYEEIQSAGFILRFRDHTPAMSGKKKGNVDTDIVYEIMYKLYKKRIPDNIILVTGDGDYIKVVNLLIEEGKFKKILFPKWEKASSLYKDKTAKYFATLSDPDIKKKIGRYKE